MATGDEVRREALRLVNAGRVAVGVARLEDLPQGIRDDGGACPIANALADVAQAIGAEFVNVDLEHAEFSTSKKILLVQTEGTRPGTETKTRLRSADVERLAHAAGLHLESFAFGIRGIPERGWALVWRDSEGKAWWLMFPNLWAVEAYLLAERPGAPGPVALEDAVRRAKTVATMLHNGEIVRPWAEVAADCEEILLEGVPA